MPCIPLVAALEALHAVRTDQVVLTNMSAGREWQAISRHELDFCHVPACMGHTSAIGLGLALAQPRREIIVLNGDGSMLMSLGNLVTIAAARPANYTMILIDNGVYEVTGRQRTPGERVDFAGLASVAGFPTVIKYDELTVWRAAAAELMNKPGPRLIHLLIEPMWEKEHLYVPQPEPMTAQIARLRRAFNG
jgi:thiamine pyrophosphate-dependent acetolactate synthase large subunit-like protein